MGEWDEQCKVPKANEIPTLHNGAKAQACDRTQYNQHPPAGTFDALALMKEAKNSVVRVDAQNPWAWPWREFLATCPKNIPTVPSCF